MFSVGAVKGYLRFEPIRKRFNTHVTRLSRIKHLGILATFPLFFKVKMFDYKLGFETGMFFNLANTLDDLIDEKRFYDAFRLVELSKLLFDRLRVEKEMLMVPIMLKFELGFNSVYDFIKYDMQESFEYAYLVLKECGYSKKDRIVKDLIITTIVVTLIDDILDIFEDKKRGEPNLINFLLTKNNENVSKPGIRHLRKEAPKTFRDVEKFFKAIKKIKRRPLKGLVKLFYLSAFK